MHERVEMRKETEKWKRKKWAYDDGDEWMNEKLIIRHVMEEKEKIRQTGNYEGARPALNEGDPVT